MKKIALFSDGTGNSSSSLQKTNVWRAYQALDRTPGSGQIAFYDNGVGTSRFSPTAMLGLGFGWGLARNVRQIYGFLCRTYDAGDEIYGFGFSRGAFTIRVVMALIASEGIIDPNTARDERDLERLIKAAYRRFRKNSFTPSMLSFVFRPVRDVLAGGWHGLRGRTAYDPKLNIGYSDDEYPPVLIKFLGVWDTVDAYGLPVDELTRAWDRIVWPLTAKDRNLTPRIERACHALALDEQRESFEPMLWNEDGRPLGKKIGGEPVSQVWFAGVHSNVGGGYPDDALAFVALDWMLTESSKKKGLTYLPAERTRHQDLADAKGPLNDSRSGVGNFYRYAPRRLERLCNQEKPGLWNWLKTMFGSSNVQRNEVQIIKPKLHYSVFERIAESDAYAPINIPEDYAVVDAAGKITDISAIAPASSPPYETAAMAHSRVRAQSLAWNKVWGRKLLFYLILLATLLFVTYPYIPWISNAPIADFLEPILGWFSFVIPAIPDLVGKIPGLGFAEGWATRFASHPYVFTIGIFVIAGLLTWSLKVNAALKSEMRRNWDLITGTTRLSGPPAGELQKSLSAANGKVRKWLAARLNDVPVAASQPKLSAASKLSRTLRIGTEGIALALFFALVVAISSRLFFVVADGTGAACDPVQTGWKRPFGETFKFNPKNTCFDTGHKLVQGKTYTMEFRLPDNWADEGIAADLNGLSNPAWKITLSTPFRRHLFLPWYQPVARVDDELFDRHPLRPADTEGSSKTAVRMQFKARRSGRLYLYVNDAVFFSPGLVDRIYRNNRGYACVIVTEIDPDPQEPAEDTYTSITELASGNRSCDLKQDEPARSAPAMPSDSGNTAPEE